jgi:hypothetical protein
MYDLGRKVEGDQYGFASLVLGLPGLFYYLSYSLQKGHAGSSEARLKGGCDSTVKIRREKLR